MPGDCAPGLVLQKFNSTFSNGGVEYPVKFPRMSQRCKAAIAKTERSPVAKFQYKIIVLCVVINPGNFCCMAFTFVSHLNRTPNRRQI